MTPAEIIRWRADIYAADPGYLREQLAQAQRERDLAHAALAVLAPSHSVHLAIESVIFPEMLG